MIINIVQVGLAPFFQMSNNSIEIAVRKYPLIDPNRHYQYMKNCHCWLHIHLSKLFNYDTNSNNINLIHVYDDKNLTPFLDKYQHFIVQEHNFHYVRQSARKICLVNAKQHQIL